MSVELSILSNTEIKEITERIPPTMESSSSNGKPQLAEGKATSEFGTESTITIDDYMKYWLRKQQQILVLSYRERMQQQQLVLSYRQWKQRLVSRDIEQASRGTNVHHESSNDLTNTTLEQKDLSCKAFAREIVVNPSSHNLLKICIIVLIAFAKVSTTSFDFQFGKTTNTSRTLLSFDDALFAFFPEMAQMSMFMICYVMIFMLVLPLQPVEQIFPALLLIFAPFIYFSELVRKASASRVDVACGGLVKLPLFRFTTLGAVWLSLICGLVIFLMVYLNRRFIYSGKPRVGGDLNHLEDRLPELLQGDSNV